MADLFHVLKFGKNVHVYQVSSSNFKSNHILKSDYLDHTRLKHPRETVALENVN